jgi:hypothetical protein
MVDLHLPVLGRLARLQAVLAGGDRHGRSRHAGPRRGLDGCIHLLARGSTLALALAPQRALGGGLCGCGVRECACEKEREKERECVCGEERE